MEDLRHARPESYSVAGRAVLKPEEISFLHFAIAGDKKANICQN
jgi:hypothetical protein